MNVLLDQTIVVVTLCVLTLMVVITVLAMMVTQEVWAKDHIIEVGIGLLSLLEI